MFSRSFSDFIRIYVSSLRALRGFRLNLVFLYEILTLFLLFFFSKPQFLFISVSGVGSIAETFILPKCLNFAPTQSVSVFTSLEGVKILLNFLTSGNLSVSTTLLKYFFFFHLKFLSLASNLKTNLKFRGLKKS